MIMGYGDFPLFRMNSLQIKWWIAGGDFRRQFANVVSKTWRTGVVMLNPSLFAVGTVDPRGRCNDIPPPWEQFEMWQVCNKPSVRYMECACRNYFDPEVQGPWHLREKMRGLDRHHPFCQFDKAAKRTFTVSEQSATARVAEKKAPQARPDEWMRTQVEQGGG